MILPNPFIHHFPYFFKRDVDKFFISVAIRNLAIGMILLFEPIYLYLYFEKSLPSTFLFFAIIFALNAVFVVLAGKIMGRVGPHWTIFASYFFYFAYYIFLFLLPQSFIFVPLAILAISIGMALYWPALYIDFVRFSSSNQRGKQVSLINIASIIPSIIAPLLGGWMIASFGYQPLFIAVILVLLSSAIPLAYTKYTHEVYTDSYRRVFSKIFSKENWRRNVAFASESVEVIINTSLWPIFLFILAIGFSTIGAITSFSLLIVSLFMLYMGKISDTEDRSWLLNVGVIMTSIAWIIKYFVRTPFDAFLAETIYKISRASADIPFKTFFFEKAAEQGQGADEFIILRDVVVSSARSILFLVLALFFFFVPQASINSVFFVAAVLTLGFMFLSKLPKIQL